MPPLSPRPETAGSELVPEETLDSQVYAELEEIVAETPRSSKQYWSVILARSDDRTLCTMHEGWAALSQSFSDRSNSLDLALPATSDTDTRTETFVAAREAVDLMLQYATVNEYLESTPGAEHSTSPHSQLQSLFGQIITDEQEDSDFLSSHAWYCRLQDFLAFAPLGSNPDLVHQLLGNITRSVEQSVERFQLCQAGCERWAYLLRPLTQLRSELIFTTADLNERLRDKMWYVADVRGSAQFSDAMAVTKALRAMGKAKRSKDPQALRTWSTTRSLGLTMHLKSDEQIFELLSAKPNHGGPNKLTDDMSRTTSIWMERQGIDNLCAGEERLHKLCLEIRKCVDASTAKDSLEDGPLKASVLFARDGSVSTRNAVRPAPSMLSLNSQHNSNSTVRSLNLHNNVRSMDAVSNASHTLSSMSSRDYIDSRSPTLATRSSTYSNATTEAAYASSVTSMGTSDTQPAYTPRMRGRSGRPGSLHPHAADRLRDRLTSLLVSDLTANLFFDGSETDRAFNTGLASDIVEKHRRATSQLRFPTKAPQSPTGHSPALSIALPRFDYNAAFAGLLRKFSASSNPATKLACLYDIDRLMVPYMAERLDEEKSKSTQQTPNATLPSEPRRQDQRDKITTEANVRGFRDIFSQPSLRPRAIFRDLQFIAALTPSAVLQNTASGKAFCNAAVALMDLKYEAITIMIETADNIVAHVTSYRRAPSSAQQRRDDAAFSTPTRTPPAADVTRYGMADAGYLLQIAAKEGDAVAQRELATLYLTHPDLMEHILAPFTPPREVFTEALETKWRRNQDPKRFDPATMCVAHHWMNLSAKSGDKLAMEFLRQREEMDTL
jgi:hypothetical protein